MQIKNKMDIYTMASMGVDKYIRTFVKMPFYHMHLLKSNICFTLSCLPVRECLIKCRWELNLLKLNVSYHLKITGEEKGESHA